MRRQSRLVRLTVGLIAGIVLASSVANVAHAAIITPSVTDLIAATQLDQSDGSVVSAFEGEADGIVKFRAQFGSPGGISGDHWVDIGIDNLNLSFDESQDVVRIKVANVNDSPWEFQLWAEDSALNTASSAVLTLDPNKEFNILEVALAGLNNTLKSVFLRVGASVPIPPAGGVGPGDRTAEFFVAAVPVPPAVLLFGSGILGIAFIARRRSKTRKPAFS